MYILYVGDENEDDVDDENEDDVDVFANTSKSINANKGDMTSL